LAGNEFSVTASLLNELHFLVGVKQFAHTRLIRAEIELIAIDKFNETHERTLRSDLKYRFVVDMASLR